MIKDARYMSFEELMTARNPIEDNNTNQMQTRPQHGCFSFIQGEYDKSWIESIDMNQDGRHNMTAASIP